MFVLSTIVALILEASGPQPFWHHGPVSWKTIVPQMGSGVEGGNGSGGNASDGKQWGAADEALLAYPISLLLQCSPISNMDQ